MTQLRILGVVAILSTAFVTPLMAQQATQEPGMVGFNNPNSAYPRGGYGVRPPNQRQRQSFGDYAPRTHGSGHVAGPVAVDDVAAGAIATAPVSPYGSYGRYNGHIADW